MSKSKNKNKPKRRGFPPVEPKPSPTATQPMDGKRPMRWGLIALFLVIAVGGTYLAQWLRPKKMAPRYGYEVVATIKHDEKAFTQGLVIQDGVIYESTGRYGESTIRKIDLKTGEILKSVQLDDKVFGEGLALHGDELFQVTWKENVAYVYDRELNKIKEFKYEGDGWGLTSDGKNLIMSDGSSILKYLDPATFEVKKTVRVARIGGLPVGRLNEMEYAKNGKIYANAYEEDKIYEIDAVSGNVEGIIELDKLWPYKDRPEPGAVLNGIAIDLNDPKFLYVTGKLCPTIFKIRVVQKQ
ncbi:MAG: glutaminyl-peptide cyclotransferase [Mariniblastus sp.]